MQIFQLCVCVYAVMSEMGDSLKTKISNDVSFGILDPFPSGCSNTTGYHTESTTHCPP